MSGNGITLAQYAELLNLLYQARAQIQQGGPWIQVGEIIHTKVGIAGVESGVGNDASGDDSVCLGGGSNTASAGGCVVLGGYGNVADGASTGVLASYECTATGVTSACVASNSSETLGEGGACVGTSGASTSGMWSACIGGTGGSAEGDNSVSIAGGHAVHDDDIAVGHPLSNLGFFGAACVPRPAGGGSGTAGAAYTANEQAMLQAVYTALLTLGLIT